MPDQDPVVRARGLGHSYRHTKVFDDLSFDLQQGVTALIGVNGAGKSTLINILT